MKSQGNTIYGILRETGLSFFQHNPSKHNGRLELSQSQLEKHQAVKAISDGNIEINKLAFENL